MIREKAEKILPAIGIDMHLKGAQYIVYIMELFEEGWEWKTVKTMILYEKSGQEIQSDMRSSRAVNQIRIRRSIKQRKPKNAIQVFRYHRNTKQKATGKSIYESGQI